MTDTTTEAVDKVADLIERLEYGVCPSGIHEDNQTELFLVDDANDTMAEAAATIRTLATRIEQLERELRVYMDAAEGHMVERMRLTDEIAAEKALADQVQELVAIAVDQYGERQSASSGKESRDWQSMKMAALDIQQAMQSAYRKARGL